jgi:hypothetical protein
MEVRKKRPRGFKKEAHGVELSPLNLLSVAPGWVGGVRAVFAVLSQLLGAA